MAKKLISIIVPCYNEGDNIKLFYNAISDLFSKLNYELELIFINDGSTDRSLEAITEIIQLDNRVKCVNLSRNFGQEIALTAGINYANGDALIPMDVDLQDPPDVVPQLINKWEEGYDVVYATRVRRDGDSLAKKTTAFLFYKTIASLTKIDIPRNTGNFRILDKRVAAEMKNIGEYHRFMKGLFSWVGFRQTGITYVRTPRVGGKTKYNFIKLVNLAVEGITSFSVAPLRLATVLGFIISVVTLVYAVYIVYSTLRFGNAVPGYSSLIVAILFLGGIQLLCMGIIGEYIGKIFNETKNRPLYIVKDLIGFKD